MSDTLRVTVWNEYLHEVEDESIAAIYPAGIHGAIAAALREEGLDVRTATLAEPEHGLSEAVLADTGVLIWWSHKAHDRVAGEVVDRIYQRVVAGGMGLVVLHSGHFSKIFIRLMGTTCNLKWREAGEKERIWVVAPGHPIAAGLPESFDIANAEMYGEHFDIPEPDQLVLISWFEGGEVFRSGCCFYRGCGKVFYFRPGHETYPIYHHPHVLRVIANAVRWAAPSGGPAVDFGHRPQPLEPIAKR